MSLQTPSTSGREISQESFPVIVNVQKQFFVPWKTIVLDMSRVKDRYSTKHSIKSVASGYSLIIQAGFNRQGAAMLSSFI